jgi:ribosomal protein S18 acetylase RimI-like enzyme
MATDDVIDAYPRQIRLPDGAEIELRLMARDDRDAVLSFAKGLPEEDLLFLRTDLTDPKDVDDWMTNIETGHSTSLAAYDGDGLVGYATVHRNSAPWMKRVGEIRVNVSPAFRGRGLGRILTSHIFDAARGLSLKKLTANMTSDQRGAQAAFRKLGFVPEALLGDYVEDRNGTSRDLVIMSYDVDGHTDQAGEPLKL